MSSDTLVDPSMNTAELFFWNSVRVLTDNVTDDNGDDVDDLHHSFGKVFFSSRIGSGPCCGFACYFRNS